LITQNYKEGFCFLEEYLLNKHDIKVKISRKAQTSAWFPRLKLIIIDEKMQWKNRLHTLAHELGHVLINEDSSSKSLFHNNNTTIKTKKQIVSTLNEEIMAWNLGKNFLIDNKIYFDITSFEHLMTECVMSYVKNSLDEVYGKRIDVSYISTC